MSKTRYVAGFAFYKSVVILIEKQRPEWQKGLWNGVGGHIEDGETPLEAMQREFKEETGVWIENWEQFCVLSGNGFEVVFFRAFPDEYPAIQKTTDERVEGWHICMLPKVIPNLNWLIPMAYYEEEGRGIPYFIHEKKYEDT
jgi:8-oxo-dGTP diphosphatase